MSAADTAPQLRTIDDALAEALSEFDFMRCGKCGRLMTKIEMRRGITGRTRGRACPCGSLKYSPANMRWHHWLLPRVWHFAYWRVLGRI